MRSALTLFIVGGIVAPAATIAAQCPPGDARISLSGLFPTEPRDESVRRRELRTVEAARERAGLTIEQGTFLLSLELDLRREEMSRLWEDFWRLEGARDCEPPRPDQQAILRELGRITNEALLRVVAFLQSQPGPIGGPLLAACTDFLLSIGERARAERGAVRAAAFPLDAVDVRSALAVAIGLGAASEAADVGLTMAKRVERELDFDHAGHGVALYLRMVFEQRLGLDTEWPITHTALRVWLFGRKSSTAQLLLSALDGPAGDDCPR